MNMPPEQESRQRKADTGNLALAALALIGVLVVVLTCLVTFMAQTYLNRWRADARVHRAGQAKQGAGSVAGSVPGGLSNSEQSRRLTPALPAADMADWFSEGYYPPYAKRAGLEGRVGVKIHVDTGGVVSDCRVVMSSGVSVLDQTTCALAIRNGKFSPARNENGRAIESDVTLPVVHWQLKEE